METNTIISDEQLAHDITLHMCFCENADVANKYSREYVEKIVVEYGSRYPSVLDAVKRAP